MEDFLQLIEAGDLDKFRESLKSFKSVNSIKDPAGNNLVHAVCSEGNFQMLKVLVEHVRDD